MGRKPIAPGLRTHVADTSRLPARLQALYDRDPRSNGYVLNAAGRQLAHCRQRLPPLRLTKLDRVSWAQLLSAAQPGERAFFLRQMAAGRMKISHWPVKRGRRT